MSRVERLNRSAGVCVAAAVVGLVGAPAMAQLRVANWNVTNYSSGRTAEFQNSIFGTAPNGLRFFPDIIVAEEITSDTGRTNFLSLLNTYPGGPTDWAATPFIATSVNPGSNPSHVMFYRTSKVTLQSQAGVPNPSTVKVLSAGTGSCSTCPPRDNHRYLVRLAGYGNALGELYLYAAHYKAGSLSSDQARRTPESDRLRTDMNALPTGAHFLLAADFNVQSSSQTAYSLLLEDTAGNDGHLFDPINSPGSWENSSTFRIIHTQEPSSAMDSRHDQILISESLRNGAGMDYIGSPTLAYSTSTWNDPNHSYRCWGNDGTSYNTVLKTSGNSMVGDSIAASLIATVSGNGHLPVYLDLRVPAKINAPLSVNFGTVTQGDTAQAVITVRNGDALISGADPHFQRFSRDGVSSAGFEVLTYSMTASAGFAAPAGAFNRTAALSAGNSHTITMDTSTPGSKSGTVTITGNGVNAPTLVISLSGTVNAQATTRRCVADIASDNGVPLPNVFSNGGSNEGDYNCFFQGFFNASAWCDIANDDGTALPPFGTLSNNSGVNEGDYNCFFQNFFNPCP